MAIYLVGTPIGNLKDITLRALEVLRAAPVIVVEKWSDSIKLLRAYDIYPPKTMSYDENNHHRMLPKILTIARETDIVYITSAGMPAVSDPGLRLVQACREHQIEVIPIPGPSAITTAITTAGLAGPYLFIGFVPRKAGQLLKLLEETKDRGRALIMFESTHRLVKTITLIAEHYPDSQLFIGKEMTKQFEQYLTGSAQKMLAKIITEPKLIKGEFTLIFRP